MDIMFAEYFRFPLKIPKYGTGVWTIDDKSALEWMVDISNSEKQRILEQINISYADGWTYERDFSYDGQCHIKYKGSPFLRVRGWGMLTGQGGYNLSAERAKEIQDSFALFITWRLNQFGS